MKRKLLIVSLLPALAALSVPLGVLAAPDLRPGALPFSMRIPELVMMVPGVPGFIRWEAGIDARRDFDGGKRLLFGYRHGSEVGLGPECETVDYREDLGRPGDFPPWWNLRSDGRMTIACADSPTPMEFTILEFGNFLPGNEWVYFESYNQTMLRAATRAPGPGNV